MREQFVNQELALLIDDARHLNDIRAEMGAENVAVVPLPSGAPLLEIDLLALNPTSDDETQAVAVQFAKSLTDVDNQIWLMAEAAQVPVNINVDSADFPLVDGFIRQSDSVVVLPNDTALTVVLETGDLICEETIDNGFDATNAVTAFVNVVDVANGLEIVEEVVEGGDDEVLACADEGEMTLWHSWDEAETLAWQTVISDFVTFCPNIAVVTTFVPEPEMTSTLSETLQAGSETQPPTLFIGRSDQQQTYLNANLIRDVNALVDESQIIDYLPRSLVAFQQGDALYGLPQHIDLQAVYYRTDRIDEPALTMNQLLEEVEAGATLGLNASFEGLIWGGSAFGCLPCLDGNFIDEQGESLIAADDLAGWLDYLETLDETGNVVFAPDEASLVAQFAAGELDYVILNNDHLHELEIEVGTANLGTVVLPSGTDDLIATPYGIVRGFFFSQNVSDSQTALAMRFATFANSRASQAHLLQAVRYVPTNNLVIVSAENPLLDPLIRELDRLILMPDSTIRQQLRELSEPIGRFETFANAE